MRINRLDHLVLTVVDIDATVAFYAGVHSGTDSQGGYPPACTDQVSWRYLAGAA